LKQIAFGQNRQGSSCFSLTVLLFLDMLIFKSPPIVLRKERRQG